jgi:hypothetical protein
MREIQTGVRPGGEPLDAVRTKLSGEVSAAGFNFAGKPEEF